jgi:ATP-dependent Lon protease
MLEEKINIARRHLWPKVLREHGLADEQIKISQPVLQHVVTDYTREAGVRNLERQLATVCRKAARRVLEKPDTVVRISASNVEQYLGTPRYSVMPPQQQAQVGTAMGLAVTEMGGIPLPVEVVSMPGKGDLQLTGQLGDVMRESVLAALSYIRTRAYELQIDPNFQDTTDLHVHLPENAIPKDGPSAGITIASAIISALTRRRVRNGLAMTGEVTLLGNVLGIGGLKDKVLAAQLAGIRTILIPEANRKDLAEIPARIRSRVKIIPVANMDQVVEHAIEPPALPVEKQAPVPLRPTLRQEQAARQGGVTPNSGEGRQDEEQEENPLLVPDQNSPDFYPPAHAESRLAGEAGRRQRKKK